jgi:hypothetical protein
MRRQQNTTVVIDNCTPTNKEKNLHSPVCCPDSGFRGNKKPDPGSGSAIPVLLGGASIAKN